MEVRGARLRPTTALVREALFNQLGAAVEGSRVLDLYAGTGALGIEALSRGAAAAVFVEGDRRACEAILANLDRTGFAGAGTVVRGKLPGALASLEGVFEVVVLDPPYGADEAEGTLLEAGSVVAAGGVVVYEHPSRYNPPERLGTLVQEATRRYGDTALTRYGQEGE